MSPNQPQKDLEEIEVSNEGEELFTLEDIIQEFSQEATPEEPQEEIQEEPQEILPEEVLESPEQPQEEPPEDSTEEPTEDSTGEPPEDSAEDSPQEPTEDSAQAPGEEATADGETPPDNLIPLYPPAPEPETVKEFFQHTWNRARTGVKTLRANGLPLPKLSNLRITLPRFELPEPEPPPDIPPRELAARYLRGISALRLECAGALLLSLGLFLLSMLATVWDLPGPVIFRTGQEPYFIALGGFLLTVLLCLRVLKTGLGSLFSGSPGMETVALFATLFTLTDALTMKFMDLRPESLPLFAPCALVLSFQLWGTYWKRRQNRQACRTAASAAQPDCMTVEPAQWNGRAVYRRREGTALGFGSQIQQEDGAQRLFRYYTPLLLLLALALSALATLAIKRQPELFFWSFSATLIAGATLSGTLCVSMPFRGLSRRLSKLGVALAGWPAVQKAWGGSGLLVEDGDLFPPGSVELTGFQFFGNRPPEEIISVTASVIREAKSGLTSLFWNLLRLEDGAYVEVEDLKQQNDGISATALGRNVMVGTPDYLERYGVALPPDVRVPMGVFTAIDGQFSGQFVLDYLMHRHSGPAMESLLHSRITPISVAMDFNLLPQTLKKLFRFPWERMAFPEVGQREKLLNSPVPRGSRLFAVLCRDGLLPPATAAVGAQRLRGAVGLATRFTCIASVCGMALVCYLSAAAALSALSAGSLCLFLLLWFLPVALISGWVNQF